MLLLYQVWTAAKPSNVSAVLSVPVPQVGAKNPRIATIHIPLTPRGNLRNSGYTLYSSVADMRLPEIANLTRAYHSTVDIIATVGGKPVVDDFRKLSVLNGTVR